MAGVRARRYCYPHCLLGKKVVSKEVFEALPKEQQEWAVTKEERDEAIRKEACVADLLAQHGVVLRHIINFGLGREANILCLPQDLFEEGCIWIPLLGRPYS